MLFNQLTILYILIHQIIINIFLSFINHLDILINRLNMLIDLLIDYFRVCKLDSRELRRERYLYTCKECPDSYPWIKNEFGQEFK